MSDGQSGDNIVSAASVFHNAGIHVTPVAMGRGADKATLRKMTGSAGLKNKFFEGGLVLKGLSLLGLDENNASS